MMDFVVRETRQVIDGPMAIIHFGSCEIISKTDNAGDIMVASEGCIQVSSNLEMDGKYTVFSPVKPDEDLTNQMMKNIKEAVGEDKVKGVLNCSAETYYGAQ